MGFVAPQDTTLQALVERGLALSRAREASQVNEAPPIEAVVPCDDSTMMVAPRSLGLASDRACVETNLARKGLWRPSTAKNEGGELVRLLDSTDQLGPVQRIDVGPPLGALAFDVIVWACSRWRERGETEVRHVPFTLQALGDDLGWRRGGGTNGELTRVLDALRQATFRARVYNARLAETRIDTFGLLDRWERGEPDRAGRAATPGFLVLGDWLQEQLCRKHVTFVNWSELRSLRSATARRLFVYLESERFVGSVWQRRVDEPLLTTLGITATKPFHKRATLKRAAMEVTSAQNHYAVVSLEQTGERASYVLVARRRDDPSK